MSGIQKSVDQYRNIISILKERLRQGQEQLQDLRNQFSSHNVFEEGSYDSKIRQKIIEVQVEQFNKEQRRYVKHKASHIYTLHFAVLKLAKICQILCILPEMVYRGIDKKTQGSVGVAEFSQALREVFSNSISNKGMPAGSTSALIDSMQKDGKIKLPEYLEFLQAFGVLTQPNKSKNIAAIAIDRLIGTLVVQKIIVQGLWKQDHLDLAEFAYGLTSQLKEVSVMECVSVYFKLNPTRQPNMQTKYIVNQLSALVQQQKTSGRPKQVDKPNNSKRQMLN